MIVSITPSNVDDFVNYLTTNNLHFHLNAKRTIVKVRANDVTTLMNLLDWNV